MGVVHLGFIVSAFALTFAVVGYMILSLVWQHRRLKSQLALMAMQLAQDTGKDESADPDD